MPSRSRVSSTRLRITSGASAELLHRVGELLLDGVGDEAGERVLADDADDVGQVAGRVLAAVSRPSTVTRPASRPPVKCGTRPLTAPSSVDLPEPVRPDDQAQLALGDHQVDVAQRRRAAVRVGDRDVLEADHDGDPAAVRGRCAVTSVGDALTVEVGWLRGGELRVTGGAIHAGSSPTRITAVAATEQRGPGERLASDGSRAPAGRRAPMATTPAATATPQAATPHSGSAPRVGPVPGAPDPRPAEREAAGGQREPGHQHRQRRVPRGVVASSRP